MARPRVGRDRHRRDLAPGAPHACQPSLRAHAPDGQGRAQPAADRPLPRQRAHRRLAGAGERADAHRQAAHRHAARRAARPALAAARAARHAGAAARQLRHAGPDLRGRHHQGRLRRARRPALRGRGAQRRARSRRCSTPPGATTSAGRSDRRTRPGSARPPSSCCCWSPSASTTAERPVRAPSPPASHRRTSACWPPAARRPSPTPSPAWATAARWSPTSSTRCPPRATSGRSVLALFDLDGFKQYNDSFGHPAGDALLVRLAERLTAATEGLGSVYRMGGDEFCLLAPSRPAGRRARCCWPPTALSDAGHAFEIGCSHGIARIPAEAATPEEALRLADQRMYAHKADRPTIGRESTDLLLQVITERGAGLGEHVDRRRPARRRHRRPPRAPRARGQAHPAGRRAARRRQDRDPRHRPQQAQRAHR